MDFLLTYMRIRQLPAEGFLRLARRPSYWKGFGTFLLGAALLGVSAIFVIYSRNVWPIYIALVVIPVIIVDLLLVNTGVVFVSQRPRLALRTAIYAVGALGQLVCAFAVVYVAMPPSYFASDHNPLTTLEFGRALYFSLVTLVTLGYGDIVPSHSVAMSVVCLQIVLGVYFLGVILATFVSWTSGRVPIVTVKDLEEESTRLATYRTHPPSHP